MLIFVLMLCCLFDITIQAFKPANVQLRMCLMIDSATKSECREQHTHGINYWNWRQRGPIFQKFTKFGVFVSIKKNYIGNLLNSLMEPN